MTYYKRNIAPLTVPFINALPPQIYIFDVKYQPLSLTNNSPKLGHEIAIPLCLPVIRLYKMEMKPKFCHMT